MKDELKQLLENAGMGESYVNSPGFSGQQPDTEQNIQDGDPALFKEIMDLHYSEGEVPNPGMINDWWQGAIEADMGTELHDYMAELEDLEAMWDEDEEEVDEAVRDWTPEARQELWVEDKSGNSYSLEFEDRKEGETMFVQANGITVAICQIGGAGSVDTKIMKPNEMMDALYAFANNNAR